MRMSKVVIVARLFTLSPESRACLPEEQVQVSTGSVISIQGCLCVIMLNKKICQILWKLEIAQSR
jgi:hypothetical protein